MMTKNCLRPLSRWLMVLLLLPFAANSTAQPGATKEGASTAAATARVDRLAIDALEVARLPAISIAILEPDSSGALGVAYSHAFGFADVASELKASSDTRFRAASVSKVITVTALARLVALKKIDWDTELASMGIDFPNPEGITPRRLAGHLAGIGHYQGQDRIDRWGQVESAVSALAAFKDSPRVGSPGEQYKYSTHGMTLLSAMMEVATGQRFPDIVEQLVAEPLRLRHTGPAPAEQGAEGMATLYVMGRQGPLPLPRPENPSYKWAGGGFATTPSDLVNLAAAYLYRDSAGARPLLAPGLIDVMWTPQSVAGEETGVGIGWRIATEPGSELRVIHHAGSMQGARSLLMLYPNERRAIAVMTNASWTSDIERTGSILMAAWRGNRNGASDPSLSLRTSETASINVRLVASEGVEPKRELSAEQLKPVSSSFSIVAGAASIPKIAVPNGFEFVTRDPVESLRMTHVVGNQWALVTPRGLARGECNGGQASVECRFDVSREFEVVVVIGSP